MAGFAEQAQVSPKYFKPFDERLEVATKVARNAIPRKYARMAVVTLDDQAKWELKEVPGGQSLAGTWGTDDSHWSPAGGAAIGAGSVTNELLATDVKVGSLAYLKGIWGATAATFAAVVDYISDLFQRVQTVESGLTTVANSLNAKVDKVTGKGLSSLDYTPTERDKLSNVTNDAQVKRTEMGVASGVATLDASAKITTSQLPDSILGQVKYKGTYLFAANQISSPDAALNNQPRPTASAANAGYYFIVQDSGTYLSKIFNPGDWLISNGAGGWEKVDNTDAVTMVAGRIGNVVLTTVDVAEDASRQYYTDARALAANAAAIASVRTTLAITTERTAAYTLALSDAGSLVPVNGSLGAAVVVTVPLNSAVGFSVGAIIQVRQRGIGGVSIAAASGVVINVFPAGASKCAGQHAEVSLHFIGSDTWNLAGAIS